MNVLVIGGTRFVGRHIVEALQSGGHSVTLFNRGKTDGAAFPGLEHVRGDRKSDLGVLDGRTWDAVIDTCGYTPDVVETAARFFEKTTERYLFISSVSVYDWKRTPGADEDAPLQTLPPGADPGEYRDEHYGALKVLCERAVERVYGKRATILRPAVVAGPFDPTDRFTYWPVRFDAGGELLAPPPESRLQYIDGRDLAAFAVRTLEHDIGGVYNCVVPAGAMRFADLYAACSRATASHAETLCPGEAFLAEAGVEPWSEFPLWVPATEEYAPVSATSSQRAQAQGLSFRSIEQTTRDTLAWAKAAGKRLGSLAAGLQPEREAQLLRQYQERLTAEVE